MSIVCLILLFMLWPSTAYAYIDPGSGSLFLQSLIAVIVGGWLTVKLLASKFWRRLRGDGEAPDRDEAPVEPDDDSGR